MNKRILILEASMKLDELTNFTEWIKNHKNSEIKYIYNVYNADPYEILAALKWCDSLAFTTTFYYADSILGIAKLLTKIEPIDIYIAAHEPERHVVNLVDDELAYGIYKHRFFEIDYDTSVVHFGIGLRRKAVVHRSKLRKEAAEAKFKAEYLASGRERPTGRKVKIKQLQYFGPESVDLKEGMIVDEIDNHLADSTQLRGIWVWGKTEPLKLLNENRYNEYEIVAMTIDDLIDEIIQVIEIKPTAGNKYTILGVLKCGDELIASEMANEICQIFDVPKRGNRGRLANLIMENKQS